VSTQYVYVYYCYNMEQSESAAQFGVRVRARVVRSTGGKNQLFVVARTRPASVALVETTPHEYYTTIIQYIIVVVELLLLLLLSSIYFRESSYFLD